ncbi:MAG: SipW-cognate class signal peptide [Eubacteriales bacterium]|jgi:predicted ribosomally synthesized peptide with SipW-like signal peptide
MNKKIAIIVTSVIVAGALAVGSTLAYFTDKGTATNIVTMGDVRIKLTETKNGDPVESGLTFDNVMPKDVIAKDPTISNIGDHDAYIRCKININQGSDNEAALTDEQKQQVLDGLNIDKQYLDGDPSKPAWVLNPADGYYYYQKVLPKKTEQGPASVNFFTQFTVPEKWGNEMAGKTFTIGITAEAIQADNFAPHKTGSVIDGWKYTDSTDVPVMSAPASNHV